MNIKTLWLYLIFSPTLLFTVDHIDLKKSDYIKQELPDHLFRQVKREKSNKKFHPSFCQSTLSLTKKFYVLTLPKSGTFLLSKMLKMLSNQIGIPVWEIFSSSDIWEFTNENYDYFLPKSVIKNGFKTCFKVKGFLIAHFNFAGNFQNYFLKNHHYVKLILIRDLRDVCVSLAYYLSEPIEEIIGPCSFDDKLMFIINQIDVSSIPNGSFWKIGKLAKIAVEWLRDPTVVVCRFEDLIGSQGGGSLEAQQNQILMISKALNIHLTLTKLNDITDHLFGNSTGPKTGSTYRKGKIGSWQTHFNEDHKEAFNRILGSFQKELGYPIF